MQTLRANERCIRMDNSSKSKTYDNQIRTQRQQAHSIHEWKKSRLNYMGQKYCVLRFENFKLELQCCAKSTQMMRLLVCIMFYNVNESRQN